MQCNAHSQSRRNGFSLIELAVVLGVLGLFAGGLTTFMLNTRTQENIALTNERLDEVKEAVMRYYTLNGYLPCPARQNVADSASTFGAATDCSAAAVAGVTDVANGSDYIRIGALPFRDLQLSPRYAYDAWGSRFSYAMIRSLATTTASSYTPSVTNGVIRMQSTSGAALTPAAATTYVPFIIISAGPDQRGGYNVAGSVKVACGTTYGDSENCDNDTIFYDSPIKDSTTAASYFFDLLRWSTNNELSYFTGS